MQLLNIFHVLVAIAMVAFILVQRGPGATAGAAFGSGASGTVFGSRGAGSFLSRSTWFLATFFCLISLTMAVVVSRDLAGPVETDLGVVGDAPTATEETLDAPAFDLPAVEDAADDDMPSLEDVIEPAAEGDLPVIDDGDVESAAEDAVDQAADTMGEDPGTDG